jgi:phenylpropionate dioxygenase-like ring-hydroxylating dioxygenase large terminal subunit
MFVRNVWYVAAWSHEVTQALLPRALLGDPTVFYRDGSGKVVALADRCPHRFVPLSAGRLVDGIVECGYHGLRFDGFGQCVLNPHGDGRIPPETNVRHYPVHERNGIIWIWPGDAERADPELIPSGLEFLDGPQTGYRTVFNYIHGNYAYDLLVDNLMDLSHVDYLHMGSFSAGRTDEVDQHIRKQDRGLLVERNQYNIDLPPAMAGIYDSQGAKVDSWQDFLWSPPGIIRYEVGVVKTGSPRDEGARFYMMHIATPETASATHYFPAFGRSTSLNDADQDELWRNIQLGPLLNEDGPMLEKQQRAFEGREFWSMKPVCLQTDSAALQVRRAMERLMRIESQDGSQDKTQTGRAVTAEAAAWPNR